MEFRTLNIFFQVPSTLLFPLLPFLLQLLVVSWFVMVALHLASTGEQEYRVTEQPWSNCSALPSCLPTYSSSLISPPSNPLLCSPETFSSCASACPGATCVFVRNIKNNDFSWLQAVNLLGLYWGLGFSSAISDLVLASVFSQWFWTWDKRRLRQSLLRAIHSITVFHLGTAAFGSLILALVRMARVLLEWLEKRAGRLNNDCGR